MRKWLGAALAAAVIGLAGCETPPPAPQAPPPSFGEAFTPIDAFVQNADMARGVNVLGYDPLWSNPSQARFTPDHFRVIRKGGFSNVRVVLQAFEHMDANNRLDPKWFATLDTMVKAALDAGLIVILDEHDFNKCADDVAACRVKLNAFWRQVAPHFKDASNRVLFEMLNEPHGAMTVALWNAQIKETLAIIRASNPTRNVVIGPGAWNGMEQLPALELPADDQHIIVTFHDYHPMAFTHQGASWAPEYTNKLGVTWGTPADYKLIDEELDKVKAWSLAHKRPIFMGEFGAYDKAPMDSRVKWTAAMARAAEARGFSWAYWQFDSDFILWDFSKPGWVEPILNALVPPNEKK